MTMAIEEEKVTLDYRYQGRLYIFEDVPAGVCQQCGEKHLTAEVAKEIERRIHTQHEWDKTVVVPMGVFSSEVSR